MKSPVVKRSIVIAGHKTSVSLEDAFWTGLKEIAGGRDITLSDLVASIDTDRRAGNLSSAIRLFVLDYYRTQPANGNSATSGPSGVTRQFCGPPADASGVARRGGSGSRLTSTGAGKAGASSLFGCGTGGCPWR